MRLAFAILAVSVQLTAGAFVATRFPLATVSGYTVRGLTTNITSPRTLLFDSAGHLLVLEQLSGIRGFTLASDGSIASSQVVLANAYLNHGLELSPDGRTLYASSNNTVWSWTYNPATFALSNQRTLVTGMANSAGGHATRTLLLSRRNPNLLLVSRGSDGNIDLPSADAAIGRAAVKAFALNSVPTNGYNYASQGTLISYGARNEVGLVEDAGGIVWGVENSADQITRTVNGVTTSVSTDNPGEKLHNFGNAANSWPVSNTTATATKFYGYPYCLSVYQPNQFPPSDTFRVGDFFVTAPNSTRNDAWCNSAVKPALLFQAHSAPLDIKFGVGSNNVNAYVGFHGSWNRQPPTGYKVVTVPGSIGSGGGWTPTAALTNPTGYTDFLTNVNPLTSCSTSCFRPTGLVWSPDGSKLYVASDRPGEIVVVVRS